MGEHREDLKMYATWCEREAESTCCAKQERDIARFFSCLRRFAMFLGGRSGVPVFTWSFFLRTGTKF